MTDLRARKGREGKRLLFLSNSGSMEEMGTAIQLEP
jgi:hypothetical protein